METFSVLLSLSAGNSPVICEFPSRRPVTRSFDNFCDLRLNKRLCKPSGWRWFGTPVCSLCHHCHECSVVILLFMTDWGGVEFMQRRYVPCIYFFSSTRWHLHGELMAIPYRFGLFLLISRINWLFESPGPPNHGFLVPVKHEVACHWH